MELEELETLKNHIIDFIKTKNSKAIKEIFETIPVIDIAECIDEIDDARELIWLLRLASLEDAAYLFAELSSDQQQLIINSFSDKELLTLLEESFTDDIVDALNEFPANMVTRILKVAPKELRDDINKLLNYKEDSAGSLMTTEYIEMRFDTKVDDAIDKIREIGKDAETIYTIFAKDYKRNLVGTVSLDDLIFAKKNQTLEDIMDKDFVTCNVNDDQEEIANKFKRYDLTAMAVVNNENKIIGIITIDDVVDVIVEEANEDIALLNHVTSNEKPYLETPVINLVLKCVPWIICLMLLQIGSAAITSHFDHLIASFAVLAVFSPLILDAGGNSGGQTTTIIVRALALDEFNKGDFKKVVWKELRVSLLISLIISTFSFIWTFFEMKVLGIGEIDPNVITTSLGETQAMLLVSALVASTLFITMIISRMIGMLLPFLAKKIKIDPAVMCGPFTTTIVDVISLLCYFLLWENLFSPLLGIGA